MTRREIEDQPWKRRHVRYARRTPGEQNQRVLIRQIEALGACPCLPCRLVRLVKFRRTISRAI